MDYWITGFQNVANKFLCLSSPPVKLWQLILSLVASLEFPVPPVFQVVAGGEMEFWSPNPSTSSISSVH